MDPIEIDPVSKEEGSKGNFSGPIRKSWCTPSTSLC